MVLLKNSSFSSNKKKHEITYGLIRQPAAWLSLKNSTIVYSQNCRLQRDWLVEGWVSEHPRNLSLGTRVQSRRLATEPVKGLKIWEGGGALCVEMGFYADISWESRCNREIKV